MLYTAFMADIVDSKKLLKEEREEIQIYIKKCLETLNNVFKHSLVFDVIFSAGDEVQGLFKTPYSAFMYFRLLRMVLAPLKIRCGIGEGEWDVKILNGTSAEQDGSAYHNARNAILQVHEISGCYILFNSGREDDIFVNTLLNSSSLLAQGQSQYQNNIYLLAELMIPFFHENSMNLNELKEIFSLTNSKNNLKFYSKLNKKKDNAFSHLNEITADCDPVYIFSESLSENKMSLKSTIKKGLSTKISRFTETSRQNIDNVIKSANISDIRNIDLTALLFLYKNYTR